VQAVNASGHRVVRVLARTRLGSGARSMPTRQPRAELLWHSDFSASRVRAAHREHSGGSVRRSAHFAGARAPTFLSSDPRPRSAGRGSSSRWTGRRWWHRPGPALEATQGGAGGEGAAWTL